MTRFICYIPPASVSPWSRAGRSSDVSTEANEGIVENDAPLHPEPREMLPGYGPATGDRGQDRRFDHRDAVRVTDTMKTVAPLRAIQPRNPCNRRQS